MHGGIGGDADFRALHHASQGIGIAAFPDKHHVRGCARTVARGRQKRFQVFGNRALRDRPAGIGHGIEIKLDGRFISADIAPACFNDAPQNGGQQRGLARSHDARDQHQTVGRHGVVKDALFDVQVFQCGRHGRNGTEDNLDASGVTVRHRCGVAAKTAAHTARFLNLVGKVVIGLPGLDERGHGVVFGQTLQRGQQLISCDGPLRDLPPYAVQPHPCGQTGAQIEV